MLKYSEHVSNDGVLKQMETKWVFIISIRNRENKFLGYIIKNVSLENLTATGYSEVTLWLSNFQGREKLRLTYLKSLGKRMKEQGLGEI